MGIQKKEGDFRARFQMNPRREIHDFARFWAYKVARNHEKSVIFRQFSLNRNLRKSMKKKQKSRENAMKEELLGQGKSMKTSSLSLWSGEIRVYSGFPSRLWVIQS